MKIGVFGKTKLDDNSEIISKAKEIGKYLATHGHTVVTGGVEGYPHIVAKSAIEAGGTAIAYAVGISMEDHAKYHPVDLSKYAEVIFQKKYFDNKLQNIDNYFRSLDLCNSVDAAVIVGGRVGTMFEVTIISGMSKDMFVLRSSGGITGDTIRAFAKEGHKEKSKIVFFDNIDELENYL